MTGAPMPEQMRSRAMATSSVNGSTTDVQGYRQPSEAIVQLLDTPVPPSYAFSPDRSKILKISRPPVYPPLSEFMRDELKLAGLRIDADIMARSRMGHSLSVSLLHYDHKTTTAFISDLPETPLSGIPPGMVFNFVRWSPKGARFAFTLRSAGGPGDPPRTPLSLWVADVADMRARCVLPGVGLNAVFEDFVWLDEEHIVAAVVSPEQGPMPEAPVVPCGPKISDNSEGKLSQARTYPDLLKNNHDEELFEWITTSSLECVNVATCAHRAIGRPRMYISVDPSPDSRFLVVSWLERPFSYELPCGRFPRVWQVWDRDGNVRHEVCRLGLQTSIPIAFDATREGPRSIGWRSDKPAVLKWVEAQDGGDPKNNPDVRPRDVVYSLDLSCDLKGQPPLRLAATDMRYAGIAWCDDDLALLYESEWETRSSRVWTFAPGRPDEPPAILFDRNYEDIYSDPGSPVYVRHPTLPTSVLARLDGGNKLLMQGGGASAEGSKPFLDVLDLVSKETQRIWQSAPPFYEAPSGTILNEGDSEHISLDNMHMLFTRESQRDPPNFYIKTFSKGGSEIAEKQVTNDPHPFPQLRDLQKEIIQYSREDGVDLNAELYLPPKYDKARDGPLPCVLWAYPREFRSKKAAGQLDKSPHEFSGIGASSPLVWLAKGYAVLSGPSMPIIAESKGAEPNDTYIEQLCASAKAAVDEVVGRGVVDPARIAVGGHSYGAFMTANILAHCGELFACGIAQSGAYNRTLTPFGFQSEQRTFWEAPHVYNTMAPFNNAHKISKPLLLIHGEADNNTGTFPLQSERMYAALQGHGCVARLVLLPHEAHGYRAYESVMHTLHENEAWLDKWCSSDASKSVQLPAMSERADSA